MRKLLAVLAVALVAIGCNSDDGGGNPMDPSQVTVEFTTTDLVVGTGVQAAIGSRVVVNYTGWLYNPNGPESKGNQFDTSAGKAPLDFVIGASNFIEGFQRAAVGMQAGGKRRVYMPPSMAYGSRGFGTTIPPNASIVFELDMVSVQ